MSRKKKISMVILILFLCLPVFLASNWGLGMMEDIALSHAPADWAASFDMGIADFYGMTMRSDEQKAVCQRFLEKFPAPNSKRGYAAYTIAVCVERTVGLTDTHSREAYEKFLDDYEDDPFSQEYVVEAKKALVRLGQKY